MLVHTTVNPESLTVLLAGLLDEEPSVERTVSYSATQQTDQVTPISTTFREAIGCESLPAIAHQCRKRYSTRNARTNTEAVPILMPLPARTLVRSLRTFILSGVFLVFVGLFFICLLQIAAREVVPITSG